MSGLSRAARALGRAWQQGVAVAERSGAAASAAAQAQQQQLGCGGAMALLLRQQHHLVQQRHASVLRWQQQPGAQTRAFGGFGSGGEQVTYAGLTLAKASTAEYLASKALGGFMWFWVFVMLYHNWEHKIYGLPYIFEKEGLDDDDDGHGHGHH